ncbi:uncharacterized protein BX663DRAFT_540586 [Cokeromyces recurvatus]|uniref:uncharacterized protein n=1 Tax=Cokeromyces recurvatus TaxID=90255 RepID=UPI00221E3E27|nr:uncharacterized protein BX663DRAFT_540586 [Cokeromyces recurvatus]KAI7905913.1 hypothetical protein BX663DRAFT_540586 [Cokeromyces recurvatus]
MGHRAHKRSEENWRATVIPATFVAARNNLIAKPKDIRKAVIVNVIAKVVEEGSDANKIYEDLRRETNNLVNATIDEIGTFVICNITLRNSSILLKEPLSVIDVQVRESKLYKCATTFTNSFYNTTANSESHVLQAKLQSSTHIRSIKCISQFTVNDP